MKLFDLHSDTPFRMYREKLGIGSNVLDCPVLSLCLFDSAVAVYAVWSDYKNCGRRNYEDFFNIRKNLLDEMSENPQCCLCTCSGELSKKTKAKLILAVEGGSLLCGDISRLSVLFEHGVRIFTPLWRGEDDIGGAHDSQKGLSLFGKSIICECERLGIVPDVSHMSESSFYDTLDTAKLPVIASHSNSHALCSVSRNLTDAQFCDIVKTGGLVGINLYPPFVTERYDGAAPNKLFDALCGHIIHFLSLGGEKCLCLGGDRDGFDRKDYYSPVAFAAEIYRGLLSRGVSENIINDIFYGNAYRFFKKRLPERK